jgi:hypothetical protein
LQLAQESPVLKILYITNKWSIFGGTKQRLHASNSQRKDRSHSWENRNVTHRSKPWADRHKFRKTASPRESISTYCGDIQQKKCALDFEPSGNSMENAPPLASRVHPFISEFYTTSSIQSPLMTFHSENVFGNTILANNDFHQSHLTAMITLPIGPENQISRRTSLCHERFTAAPPPSVIGAWPFP